MKSGGWNKRFLTSTRGQLVSLLRSEAQTVEEMAKALHISGNAVRSHLTALERDGIVQQSGVRPGTRRPHATYSLTTTGEAAFPKAYGPLLCELLVLLSERLASEELDAVLRDLGRRMAAPHRESMVGHPMPDRIQRVEEVLVGLGGSATVTVWDNKVAIQGAACPLADAVACCPRACLIAETMVSEILGVPAHERCDRSGALRCHFEADLVGST